MKQKINFDDLKRLHDSARIAKVGSREWIEFATTVINEFPAIYSTAKELNNEYYRLRNQVATGKKIVQAGMELMTLEQMSNWGGQRSFLEQDTSDYSDTPETSLQSD